MPYLATVHIKSVSALVAAAGVRVLAVAAPTPRAARRLRKRMKGSRKPGLVALVMVSTAGFGPPGAAGSEVRMVWGRVGGDRGAGRDAGT